MTYKYWTHEETEHLKNIYTPKFTLDEILKEFPDRTRHSVLGKAAELGLRRPATIKGYCPYCGQLIPQETQP
jgi:hypothetical protein